MAWVSKGGSGKKETEPGYLLDVGEADELDVEHKREISQGEFVVFA